MFCFLVPLIASINLISFFVVERENDRELDLYLLGPELLQELRSTILIRVLFCWSSTVLEVPISAQSAFVVHIRDLRKFQLKTAGTRASLFTNVQSVKQYLCVCVIHLGTFLCLSL